MQVKRQLFQIYTEYDDFAWMHPNKNVPNLRAAILETLVKYGLREYMPNRKNGFTLEDVIRLHEPETEIKWGITCNTLYVQVSVSDINQLFLMNEKVQAIFLNFFKPFSLTFSSRRRRPRRHD